MVNVNHSTDYPCIKLSLNWLIEVVFLFVISVPPLSPRCWVRSVTERKLHSGKAFYNYYKPCCDKKSNTVGSLILGEIESSIRAKHNIDQRHLL